MNKDIIHIAYAFDDNYTEISCVSMASILYNTKKTVHFHIMESSLSDDSKRKLLSLKVKFPHGEWTFHSIKDWNVQAFIVGQGYYTIETYYRLLLPVILPNLDRVIYLDGDTVIERDIGELWNEDLCGKSCGAVPALYEGKIDKKKYLEINEEYYYFCAGVLLLDLSKLRDIELYKKSEIIIPKLYEIYQKNKINWCVDQEVLNYLLHNDYLALPIKYNMILVCTEYISLCKITLHDWREALTYPVIIHYAGKCKPNKISGRIMSHPMWERYYTYKAMTPYATDCDKYRIEQYRQMEACMDNALIIDPIKYIDYKKHALFSDLAVLLRSRVIGKKLVIWGVGVDTNYIIGMLYANDICADLIVDRLPENKGKMIYHYSVQKPEILINKSNEYFVLLCMRNDSIALEIMSILSDYGYDENAYYHVFAPLWNSINGIH